MAKYCNHCMKQLDDSDKFCPACGKSNGQEVPAHHLVPGTLLNRRYSVGYALGEGGFGITYIGRDTTLDMKVAIKEFYPNGYVNRSSTVSPTVNNSITGDRKNFFEKGLERFLNEARILARFSGELGIVDVRDFFEENNTAYIVMEFLEGRDLKEYLKKNGTLTPEYTVKLLMPVMNSLKKIHAQGLIHRDISPDNIMVIGNRVKLLDFGAARSVSAEANKSLSVMLKPGYAPEEQYRSKGNQGPWTDIYALCATMYKCITGITPDDAAERMFSDEVKTPTALGITIDRNIEAAIMKGMSVRQADRYQNIDELLKGLKGVNPARSGSDKTMAGFGDDDSATMFVGESAGDNFADDDKTQLGTTQIGSDGTYRIVPPPQEPKPPKQPKQQPKQPKNPGPVPPPPKQTQQQNLTENFVAAKNAASKNKVPKSKACRIATVCGAIALFLATNEKEWAGANIFAVAAIVFAIFGIRSAAANSMKGKGFGVIGWIFGIITLIASMGYIDEGAVYALLFMVIIPSAILFFFALRKKPKQ